MAASALPALVLGAAALLCTLPAPLAFTDLEQLIAADFARAAFPAGGGPAELVVAPLPALLQPLRLTVAVAANATQHPWSANVTLSPGHTVHVAVPIRGWVGRAAACHDPGFGGLKVVLAASAQPSAGLPEAASLARYLRVYSRATDGGRGPAGGGAGAGAAVIKLGALPLAIIPVDDTYIHTDTTALAVHAVQPDPIPMTNTTFGAYSLWRTLSLSVAMVGATMPRVLSSTLAPLECRGRGRGRGRGRSGPTPKL